MNNDILISNLYSSYYNLVKNKDSNQQRQVPCLSKSSFERISGLIFKGGKFEKVFKPSGINFDQFSLLLDLFLKRRLIKIEKNGIIVPSSRIRMQKILRTPKFGILKKDIKYFWKSELNQYPCDDRARKERIKLFCEYFPINREINVAILGDGDRNSLSISSQENTNVTVFEKDVDLIKKIEKISSESSLPITFVQKDLQKPLYDFRGTYDCFICDPPYTLGGLCCWIKRGYEMLKNNDSSLGFVFFANDMMRQEWKEELLKFISGLDARLIEFRRSFNSYKHPKHYLQYERAKKFALEYRISEKRFEYWGAWSHVLVLEFFKTKPCINDEMNFDNVYYFN